MYKTAKYHKENNSVIEQVINTQGTFKEAYKCLEETYAKDKSVIILISGLNKKLIDYFVLNKLNDKQVLLTIV